MKKNSPITSKNAKTPNPHSKTKPAPQFAIIMSFGTDTPKELDATKLDSDALCDLAEQANGKELLKKSVTLEALKLCEWPISVVENYFRLAKILIGDGKRTVKLKMDGQDYSSPFKFASSFLVSMMTSSSGIGQALDIMAAVLTHCSREEDLEIRVEEAINCIRKEGFSNQRCRVLRSSLKKRLKSATPIATVGHSSERCISPYSTALLFLQQQYCPLSPGSTADDVDDEDEEGPDDASGQTPYRLRYYEGAFYRRSASVWRKASEEDLRLELTTYLQKNAPDLTSIRRIADVFANVKALCTLRIDLSPPLPFFLGSERRVMLAFANGLLDLTALASKKSPKLLPHDPNWFSTSVLPYKFDPNAKCPNFRKFLGQILDANPKTLKAKTVGDKRVKVIQEMLGYVFLTDNRFQRFFALMGKGWNGKGTLLHVLQHLIGAENISSVSLEAMGRDFGTWSLLNKMVNLCGDMNEIDNAKEGTLKTWTGEDLVTVERKHLPAIQVEPTIKFIYATNALPWFKDKTNGTWRRMIVVPFTFALKSDHQADPHLRATLRTELPGILNWALKGLTRLLEQENFTDCDVCTAAAEKHRADCTPVQQFINDHFTFADGYTGKETGLKWTTTTNAIMAFVKEQNERHGERHISAHIVCRELAGMQGVTYKRPTTCAARKRSGALYYYGICIGDPKSVIPSDEDENEDEVEDTTSVKPGPNDLPKHEKKSQAEGKNQNAAGKNGGGKKPSKSKK